MATTVHESARDIPVFEETEVLVAGGGISGCAAAVASARAGAKTILIERNGCLGGVATASMMGNIGNHYLTASGAQVVRGISGEVVDRLVACGAASPGWRSREVPGCVMDSERLKVVLIEMLEEAGVTVLTHAMAARPIAEGGEVRGAFFEGKSGRQAVLARNTVDATGEIDLAYQAGAEIVEHRGNSSLLFKVSGVDLDRFVEFLRKDPDGFPAGMDWVRDVETLARNWHERGVFFFPHWGGKKWRFLQEAVAAGDFRPEVPPAVHLDVMGMYGLKGCGSVAVNSNYYIIERMDVRDLSRFELHAQKMCYYVGDFLKRKVPGFEKSRVEHVGVDLGLRGSRYIRGRTTLPMEEMKGTDRAIHHDDAVGLWAATGRDETKEFFLAHTTDIPLGVTVPKGVSRLLVGTGKAVSCGGGNHRMLRGMSVCMMIGQTTGVAAALGAKSGAPAADVPVRSVQKELLRQGAYLGSAGRLKEMGLE